MRASRRLTRANVPAYLLETWGLRCSHRTLARLAVNGGGPPFHKTGRDAYYDVPVLDAWAQKRLGPAAETATEHRKKFEDTGCKNEAEDYAARLRAIADWIADDIRHALEVEAIVAAAKFIERQQAELEEWKQAARVEAGLRREFHDKLESYDSKYLHG